MQKKQTYCHQFNCKEKTFGLECVFLIVSMKSLTSYSSMENRKKKKKEKQNKKKKKRGGEISHQTQKTFPSRETNFYLQFSSWNFIKKVFFMPAKWDVLGFLMQSKVTYIYNYQIYNLLDIYTYSHIYITQIYTLLEFAFYSVSTFLSAGFLSSKA